MNSSKDLMKVFDWDNPKPHYRDERLNLPAVKEYVEQDYDTELDKMLELAGVRRATDANGDPTDPLYQPLPNAEYRGRIGGPTMADRVPPKHWPNMVTGEIKKY